VPATRSPRIVLASASGAQAAVSFVNFGLPSIGPDLRRHFGLTLPELGAELTAALFGSEISYGVGIDGFRALWLDWLAPWETYRAEPEKAIDLGDRVLWLGLDFGRRKGSAEEVRAKIAVVWTFRDGKVVRWDGYADRDEAFKALGLAE